MKTVNLKVRQQNTQGRTNDGGRNTSLRGSATTAPTRPALPHAQRGAFGVLSHQKTQESTEEV